MYALWVHARDINNKAEADAVLARARSSGVTDLFFQVLDDLGRAHYDTTLFAKCPDVGTFNPLGYLAQQPGIRAHAWLCVAVDVLRAHPEWNVRATQGLPTTYASWADFTRADVRQFCADWCRAITTAYPSAGIHLDYLRWDVKFGGDKLPFAASAPITATYRAIASAIPPATPLTAAVAWNPAGNTESYQTWGEWLDTLDAAIVMAYPGNVAELASIMARSAAVDKRKVGVGLSGLYFQYNPYRETRLTVEILAALAGWVRDNGYPHLAWFDYTKLSAEQYTIVAQFAPPFASAANIAEIVQELGEIADQLQIAVGHLEAESASLKATALDLAAIADRLAPLDSLATTVATKARRLAEGL